MNCSVCGVEVLAAKDHTAAEQTDCTVAVNCSVCGEVVHAAKDHAYANGTCTICGAEEPSKRLDIRGVNRAKSLSLKDVIYVNVTVGFTDSTGLVNATGLTKEYILANAKVLFWGNDLTDESAAVLGTEKYQKTLAFSKTYSDGIDEYKTQSEGIAAKEFKNKIYYRTYIELDGEVYYGDLIEYSVVDYCVNQINSTKTTVKQNNLRALCAAMLNFGAAAQLDLEYQMDDLANDLLPSLVESGKLDAKYLTLDLDESTLPSAKAPAESMTVNFAVNDASITAKSLSLKGAIEVNITVGHKFNGKVASALAEGATLTYYFWTSDTYESLFASGTALTKENADYTKSTLNEGEVIASSYSTKYGQEYKAKPQSIAAKDLDETFYVVAIVTEADGTEYCTGVEGYSPMQYAINQLGKDSAKATLKNLCRWMAVYCEAAETYLSN